MVFNPFPKQIIHLFWCLVEAHYRWSYFLWNFVVTVPTLFDE
jgi:hypothetical protein